MSPAELHAWLVARWTEQANDFRFTLDTLQASNPTHSVMLTGWLENALDGPIERVTDADDAVVDGAEFARFVVRACEAALHRLERHRPDGYGYDCSRCMTEQFDDSDCGRRQLGSYDPWPCPEVLDDAAPFADRSDFSEELRRG